MVLSATPGDDSEIEGKIGKVTKLTVPSIGSQIKVGLLVSFLPATYVSSPRKLSHRPHC